MHRLFNDVIRYRQERGDKILIIVWDEYVCLNNE